MATKPRGWTGTRTPSALKRVRTAKRRTEVNGPRRSAAKTLVAQGGPGREQRRRRRDAAGARRGSVGARSGRQDRGDPPERRRPAQVAPDPQGERSARRRDVQAGAKVTKSTGKAAAAKAAKARIAAGKAAKAKGAQTAAGKARAALSKTARAEAAAAAGKAAAGKAADRARRPGRRRRPPPRPGQGVARRRPRPAAPKAEQGRREAGQGRAKATAKKAAPKA